jgi:NADPH:quinone reductase
VKAAVYYDNGPPGVLHYEDVPDPICGPLQVKIRVEAISIEGGDTLNRAGGVIESAPHIVGYQCAGTIIEVGKGVRDRTVGQRVAAFMWWGSHAELAVTEPVFTWPVPDGADIIEAACVPAAFGTAHDCLFEFGKVTQGETVLIHAGASGVGVAAIQLAKGAGARVLATASSRERLDRLHDLGMDVGIDYTSDTWVDEVTEATDGRGADLIIDPVGGSVLQASISSCLAYRGRIVAVGQAGREGRTIDVTPLVRGNQALLGVLLGAEMTTDRVQSMIHSLLDDAASGRIQVVIDRRFPLSEAAAAHEHIESRQAVGRVVLIP